MKIVDASTLRDGGTTCVSIDEDGVLKHATFDYRLPWDGRVRYLYVADEPFGMDEQDRLPLNSREESQLITDIETEAISQIGREALDEFYSNLERNPCDGIWFYVLNFLRIAANERDAS